MFRFDNATIAFNEAFSLKNMNWEILPGSCWVIVGPNGSGKSALVSALAGEYPLASGSVETQETVVAMVSLEEQASLIDREKRLDDSDLTDKISQGTSVREMLDEVCLDPELQAELIVLLRLDSLLDHGFRKLSTGETRKVLLVRALTSKPELLVLDEPFEGLDAATALQVRALLDTMVGEITVVFALNRLDEIPEGATHALRLERGVIAQQFEAENGAQARRLLSQISNIRSEDLDLPPPIDSVPLILNSDGSLVSLVNTRVAYSDRVVFDQLNWTIRPGEHWQVKGVNGSGKTCLLSLITGDHPQCYVNDISVFGMKRGSGESIWQVKQHLGFVSTALHWDYRLSVSVLNVILSGFFDSIGVYQSASEEQKARANDWLALMNLAGRHGEPFSKLSYGEQRLVLIARSMVKHPALLLLDEPCLGLDEGNRALVLSLIRRICDEGRTTVVYVTHHQEDAIENIHHSLVLGKL